MYFLGLTFNHPIGWTHSPSFCFIAGALGGPDGMTRSKRLMLCCYTSMGKLLNQPFYCLQSHWNCILLLWWSFALINVWRSLILVIWVIYNHMWMSLESYDFPSIPSLRSVKVAKLLCRAGLDLGNPPISGRSTHCAKPLWYGRFQYGGV